jgi:hypothetical protein
MKCGTTSLHNYLGEHPDVFMSKIKEPKYFLPDNNFSKPKNSNADILQFMLKGYNGEKRIGESTTQYTKSAERNGVPERCKEIDNIKFIYVLRNPFQRIISHYQHSERFGKNPLEEFNLALQNRPGYLNVSLYYFQLSQYLKHFDKDRFKIIIFEEFINDISKVLKEIFIFLEVDPQLYSYRSNYNVYNRNSFVNSEHKFERNNFKRLKQSIRADISQLEIYLEKDLSFWDISEETWCI